MHMVERSAFYTLPNARARLVTARLGVVYHQGRDSTGLDCGDSYMQGTALDTLSAFCDAHVHGLSRNETTLRFHAYKRYALDAHAV